MDIEAGAHIDTKPEKEMIKDILAQKQAILTADIFALSTSTILTEVSSLIEYGILVDPDNEVRCPFCGGFYNPDKYSACPHCEEKDADSIEEVWENEDYTDDDEEDYEGALEGGTRKDFEEGISSQKDLKTLALEQLEEYLAKKSEHKHLQPICKLLLSNSRIVKLADHEALCLIDPRIVSEIISLKKKLAQPTQESRGSLKIGDGDGLPLLDKERLLDILARAKTEERISDYFPSYDDFRQVLALFEIKESPANEIKSLLEKVGCVFGSDFKKGDIEDKAFVWFYNEINSLSSDNPSSLLKNLAGSISDGQISKIENYLHIRRILSFLKEAISILESESKKRTKGKTPISKERSYFSQIVDTKPSCREIIRRINLLIDTFLLLDDEMVVRIKVVAGILDELDSLEVSGVASSLLSKYLLYIQNLLKIKDSVEKETIIPVLKEVVSSIDKRRLRTSLTPTAIESDGIPLLSIRKSSEGSISVTLNPYLPPNLEISPLVKEIDDNKTKNFLDGLPKRDRLVFSIGTILSKRQSKFFLSDNIDEANRQLSNLTQAEIAKEISGRKDKTAEGRISRLINAGILIRTDLGSFPIQYFLITNEEYLKRNREIVEEIIISEPGIKEKELLEKVREALPEERREDVSIPVLRKFLKDKSLLKKDREKK